jgi:FlaG protein
MSGEPEAIRGVAAADLGSGLRRSDSAVVAKPSASRSRPAETVAGDPLENVGLVFEVNRDSHEVIIKVVDRETKQIIREIPPAEVRKLRSAMQSILGLLLDSTG